MQKTILVTGATGKQGFAVSKALTKSRFKVKAFIREKSATTGIRTIFKGLGIEICVGDFDDIVSIREALSDVYGAFSVFQMDFNHTDSERKNARAFFSIAKELNVTQIVHTSVSQTGNHDSFRSLLNDSDELKYWTDKDDVENILRAYDFPLWTIFRPSSLMENYKPPMLEKLHPFIKDNRIITVYDVDKKFQLVTVEDIAKFVTAAFSNPAKFDHKAISLASDQVTMNNVVSNLNDVLEKKLKLNT